MFSGVPRREALGNWRLSTLFKDVGHFRVTAYQGSLIPSGEAYGTIAEEREETLGSAGAISRRSRCATGAARLAGN